MRLSTVTELNVAQYTVAKHLEVWVFKTVPAGPTETVLQLLRGSVWPSLMSLWWSEQFSSLGCMLGLEAVTNGQTGPGVAVV